MHLSQRGKRILKQELAGFFERAFNIEEEKNNGSMPVFEGWGTTEALHYAISVEVGNGELCSNKDIRLIDALETTKVPENNYKRIKDSHC